MPLLPVGAIHCRQSFEACIKDLNDVSPRVLDIHACDSSSQFDGSALSASPSLQDLLHQGVGVWISDADMEETTSVIVELLLAFLESRIQKLEYLEPDSISCGHICQFDFLQGVSVYREYGGVRTLRAFDMSDLSADDLEAHYVGIPLRDTVNIADRDGDMVDCTGECLLIRLAQN
jgi:hypothetical protein